MARINLDDRIFADIRFKALCRIVGNHREAIGTVIEAFQLGQKYWGDDKKLIPFDVWELSGLDALIASKLAEKLDMGVYIKGAEKHFEWLVNRQLAGKKSAESRKIKYGSACPLAANRLRTEPERCSQYHEQDANTLRTAHEPPITVTVTDTLSNEREFPEDADALRDLPAAKKKSVAKKSPSSQERVKALSTVLIWEPYREHFFARYKTEPQRTSEFNTHANRILKSVPQEKIPSLVKFYLECDREAVVKAFHPIGWLAKGESLHRWLMDFEGARSRHKDNSPERDKYAEVDLTKYGLAR